MTDCTVVNGSLDLVHGVSDKIPDTAQQNDTVRWRVDLRHGGQIVCICFNGHQDNFQAQIAELAGLREGHPGKGVAV